MPQGERKQYLQQSAIKKASIDGPYISSDPSNSSPALSAPTASPPTGEVFDQSLLQAIHKHMEEETSSDAHHWLNRFIDVLKAEGEQLDSMAKHKTLSLRDSLPQQPSLLQLPNSQPSQAFTRAAALPTSAFLHAAAVNVADIPVAGIASTPPNERLLIVTQTVYVTATPSTITTTATATAELTGAGANTSITDLMNKYNSHPQDNFLPIVILLAVFGTILVIGMLIGCVWWRKQNSQSKKQAIDREMEEQSRRRQTGHLPLAQYNGGLSTSQHQDRSRQTEEIATTSHSNSRRPSKTPSATQNVKSFKGKRSTLPQIDTSRAQVEDAPISPTFVPLPGTPMRLVSRQQVYEDPQRRRGVDALDLAAQQESNHKYWKAANQDQGSSSNDHPRSADDPAYGSGWGAQNHGETGADDHLDDLDATGSTTHTVDEGMKSVRESERESLKISHAQRGPGQHISDVAEARRILRSVEL